MPKPSKQTIIDAIIKGIEQGKDRGKLLATIAKKWQISNRTFDRHWKVANIQHAERQSRIKEKLAKVDEDAAIEARKKAIMTSDERKELLTSIANGTLRIKKPFVIAGKIMEYPAEPDHTDRKNAIAELNKMEGDYAPTKIKATVTSSVPILSLDPLADATDNK
jgi:hypothetical protein